MAHLTRYHMYKSIGECLRKHGISPLTGKILGISGIGLFRSHIDTKRAEIVEAYYPEVDMQSLPYENNTFDHIVCDQVIEHLEDPFGALEEAERVLKKGGTLILTTCFMNAIHPSPIDFWRFSPDALRHLCGNFDHILECGGWGNRIALLLCMLGNRFRFHRVTDNKWGLFNIIANFNEPDYPIVTWIVARK